MTACRAQITQVAVEVRSLLAQLARPRAVGWPGLVREVSAAIRERASMLTPADREWLDMQGLVVS